VEQPVKKSKIVIAVEKVCEKFQNAYANMLEDFDAHIEQIPAVAALMNLTEEADQIGDEELRYMIDGTMASEAMMEDIDDDENTFDIKKKI